MTHQVNQVNKTCSMAARLEVAFEAWRSVDTARTVFLGELPETTNRSELLQTLSNFGKVQKLVLPKEPKTKRLKGHGKAVYLDPQGAKAALEAGEGTVSGVRFEIKGWVDPITYIQQRDMKAHRKVYVKHKSVHTEKILIDYFQKFGPIEDIDMRFNFNSNRSRNFCYIVFKYQKSARAAASFMHELMGQVMLCEMCRPSNPLGTVTILPSNSNIDVECRPASDKIWHNLTQLHTMDRGPDYDSLIWEQQLKKAQNNESGPFTSTELRQPAKNSNSYHYDLNGHYKNKITSLNQITKGYPKEYQIMNPPQAAIADKCQQLWLPPTASIYRLSLIDCMLQDHDTKPTSSHYSSKKSKLIELMHREDDNVFFKRIKPTLGQEAQASQISGIRLQQTGF